jgi:Putative Zn-dependent protease, contains TPR repeats
VNDDLQTALAYARAGKLVDAERMCERLIRQPAVAPETRHLLGVIYTIQNRCIEAEPLLRQASAESPSIAKYHSSLGNALRGLHRLEDAEMCYRRALALDPGFTDARVNLAKLLHAVQGSDEAIAEYRRVLHDRPDDLDVLASLAFLLESSGQRDAALQTAQQGLALAPTHPAMNLVAAICERSNGQPEQALQRLQAISPAGLDARLAATFHYERGLLHDRFGQTDDAWADFVAANDLQARSVPDGEVDKRRYTAELDRLARTDFAWLRDCTPLADGLRAPVVLVGFPRSGTTLLDQILDSHAAIQTLEEKPIVNRLEDDIARMTGNAPDALAALRDDQIAALRQRYFAYVADFIDLQPGALLIDKFPLNLTRIPTILRLFPDARFILALRHPCDCVLSCFMHLFAPNDAMANFYTLADSAALYDRVMRLWQCWAPMLRQHRVHYERLVDDLPGEIKPLLDFLNVEWNERMARPHEHALQRGAINTPSYSQVVQPIYRRAAGRWQRYREQFAPVMPTLQPHIEYFGYGDD